MATPGRKVGSSLAELLQQAETVSREGDLVEAERLYRQILDRSPANIEAWMGLGSVLSDPPEQAACFEQVLQIDPYHQEAAARLQQLQVDRPVPSPPEALECAFHPGIQTVLRCSECGRPICTRCARPYQVGQLCPLCVQKRRLPLYQPKASHLLLAFGATFLMAALFGLAAALLARWLWFLLLLAGPMAGSFLAQAALLAGGRHRGPAVQIAAGIAAAGGSLVGGMLLVPSIWANPFFLLYVGLAIASAVAWLR